MDRAEFPLSVSAMSWSAPGKNTVDDRNYVATHRSHGIQTMIDSCLRFTYFQPVSIFVFS